MDDRSTTKYVYSLQGLWDYVAVYKGPGLSIFRYDEEAFDFETFTEIEDTGDSILGVCFLPAGEFTGIRLAVLYRRTFRIYSIAGASAPPHADITIPTIQQYVSHGALIFLSSLQSVLIGSGCDLSIARGLDSYRSVAITLPSGGDYKILRKDITLIIKIFEMTALPRSTALSIAFVQRSNYLIISYFSNSKALNLLRFFLTSCRSIY